MAEPFRAHGQEGGAGRSSQRTSAPDAPVTGSDGTQIRLFDLFRGPHATRLTFGVPAPDEPHAYAVLRPGRRVPGPFVTDTGGHAHSAYDASAGTVAVVRPDGYLAAHGTDRTPVPG